MGERPDSSRQLEEALSRWEQTVDDPTLPGETAAWCGEALAGLEHCEKAFASTLENHAAEYAQILKADIGLTPRVEELRQADSELRRKLDDLKRRLRRCGGNEARAVETSEEPVEEASSLRQGVLDFIVHCRAHEAELQTWLLESFYRDRGAVD